MMACELSLIRVDVQDYMVSYADEPLINQNHQECFGQCDINNKLITVKSNRPCFAQYHTLMHEIMHAIIHERGVTYGETTEETFIDEIAAGLVGLVRDNPDLFNITRG